MLEPVAELVETRLPAVERSAVTRSWLRPPGAIDEPTFLDKCYRCGACVDVCPAKAILPSRAADARLAGTPVIDPNLAACVVCEGLQCTQVCPSGALTPLHDPGEIRMGLAVVNAGVCVRSHGENCTICVDKCPIGAAAIRIDGSGPPLVVEPGCVGCGVCQLYCPTLPKAIVVRPS